MLMWEIDASLSALAELYGFERAANIYRRCLAAVSDLRSMMNAQHVPVRSRRSLYLAGEEASPHTLLAEADLRQKAGLPSDFLDGNALSREFGIIRPAALASLGSADADPLRLAHAMMRLAIDRGARLSTAEATHYHRDNASVTVALAGPHVIEAQHVVLATGYAMPDFVASDLHSVASTWAIATAPQPERLWRDGALIWEAAKGYCYARTTDDGRIVIGGEDEDNVIAQDERDALTPRKTDALTQKLRDLWPPADATPRYAWSGAFGTTRDGLPLIGPVPDAPRIYAAYGYGGNGITFSFMAARMIGELIVGRTRPWFDDFALQRAPR
jgi:glycine/D-amino acid oxidase-like deaminating enzyme